MSVSSDFNLQRINTKEFADNIAATIEIGGNLLAVARRGSGKTSIAKDAIKASKCKEVYLNLSLMERPDIGGYPNFFGARNGEKYIDFLMPSIFRDLIDGDTPCVAVLDEVDKADNSLLAPLLEFTQFRSINGFKLKNLQAILMTGNLQAEGGRRPPLPLLDRCEKFLVEMNPQHWLDWGAKSNEVHSSVAAFISENMNDLTGELEQGEAYADKSPRSWHAASMMVKHGERLKWNPQMILHKVSACVGKQVGTKYSSFFTHYQELLPVLDRIMKGEKVQEFHGFEKTKQVVISMMLCERFARIMDKVKEANKDESKKKDLVLSGKEKELSGYVARFLHVVDPEMALIAIRSSIGFERVLEFNLIEDKAWDAILEKFLKAVQ